MEAPSVIPKSHIFMTGALFNTGFYKIIYDICYLITQVDTIPDIEKKLSDTEQRLENTQALLEIVSQKVCCSL